MLIYSYKDTYIISHRILPLESMYLVKKLHQNPLGSFKDLSKTHQSALGPRGGLWPVLLVVNP
jgi:hypothetical protein